MPITTDVVTSTFFGSDFDINQLKTIQTCSMGTHALEKAAKTILTSSMRKDAP
jgi:hypothetical protein